MDMVQLSRIHESAAQKYKVGFTEKYRCIYIDFSRRCAPIIKKKTLILIIQLCVMGGKHLAHKFIKHVDTEKRSEIGSYQIYFSLKLKRRNILPL